MKKEKVKVFYAYGIKDIEYYQKQGMERWKLEFEYDGHLLDEDGMIDGMFKPLEEDLHEMEKYVFDADDEKELKKSDVDIMKSKARVKELQVELDKAQKELEDKENRKLGYVVELLEQYGITQPLYDGDYWECPLSPLGRCLYEYKNHEYECIFCGNPEERK